MVCVKAGIALDTMVVNNRPSMPMAKAIARMP